MSTDWSAKRKFIYGAGVVVVLLLVIIYFFRNVLFPQATCFDNRQNGFETGLDCGGECSLRCSQDIIPLSVSWARALRSSEGVYDIVGVVSNKNINSAPKALGYAFTVYDRGGNVLKELSGTTTVPLDGEIPIIIQSQALPIAPGSVRLVINQSTPFYTALENPTSPTLRVAGTRYEKGSIPKVYATIINTKRIMLRNIPVRALLYDAENNVYAVGQSIIPELGKEGIHELVFTWDDALPHAPTRTRIIPVLDPFHGSR